MSCCSSCTSSTSFETKLKKVHEVQYLSAGSAIVLRALHHFIRRRPLPLLVAALHHFIRQPQRCTARSFVFCASSKGARSAVSQCWLSNSTIRGFIELLHFVHFEHLLETKLKTCMRLSAGSAIALFEVSLSCCTSCTTYLKRS